MTAASAPGKLILCGEHAVVYGRPAIALPLPDIRAHAQITPGLPGSGVQFRAPDLERAWYAHELPDDPLSELARATVRWLDTPTPDLMITLTSTIPIASGMGSGAAVATALVRALTAHLGYSLPPADVSALVYASEQRYHGTPSGIDNTVIAYEQALWFTRRMAPDGQLPLAAVEPVTIAQPLTLVVGDTGVRSETRLPVGEVRRRWQAEPDRYTVLFDQVGALVHQIRAALAAGDNLALGTLLNANQALLEQIGVSSPELERLVATARAAGALGAKLSGGGWGGVMLALTDSASRASVSAALQRAGATRVLETVINATAQA